MAVKHGGNLLQIAAQYQSDVNKWIDLSTGVSPFTFPVTDIPSVVWNQLPQVDDGLEVAAKEYYNAPLEPVAVSGSQAAIMALPTILTGVIGRCATVALPRVGYKEHEHAWRSFEQNNQRCSIVLYDDWPNAEQVKQSDVVVIINPNNPTAKLYQPDKLLKLRADLAAQNATLIIDEAFVDVTPEISVLTPALAMGNLIVLRSVGKFFGLAGARVGFVFANDNIKNRLLDHLGPWTLTGPSRWVMKQALLDVAWQAENRIRLKQGSKRLKQLLASYLPLPLSATYLFVTLYINDAAKLHKLLCKAQVLTRLCDENNALRFGLPADESQWQKLSSALQLVSKEIGDLQ